MSAIINGKLVIELDHDKLIALNHSKVKKTEVKFFFSFSKVFIFFKCDTN